MPVQQIACIVHWHQVAYNVKEDTSELKLLQLYAVCAQPIAIIAQEQQVCAEIVMQPFMWIVLEHVRHVCQIAKHVTMWHFNALNVQLGLVWIQDFAFHVPLDAKIALVQGFALNALQDLHLTLLQWFANNVQQIVRNVLLV